MCPCIRAGHTFYAGKGCDACRGTGFKGRVGLYEIITSTPELREMIARRAPVQQITEYVKVKQNMRTMLEDGYAKIAQGLTTPKEVFTAVYSTMSVNG